MELTRCVWSEDVRAEKHNLKWTRSPMPTRGQHKSSPGKRTRKPIGLSGTLQLKFQQMIAKFKIAKHVRK